MLLTLGHLPFEHRKALGEKLSPSVLQVLRGMLDSDPSKRLHLADALDKLFEIYKSQE